MGEYLADLVRENGEDADWPPSPVEMPDGEELRAAVAVGLASPPVASVDEMFAKLRRVANRAEE